MFNCSSSRCQLNNSGHCMMKEADLRAVDDEAQNCGQIRVNDRYLLWKYGVTYEELICGNCNYYEAGEYSWGICTSEKIKPHPKGVTENGEKKYTESKEYYSGAHACGNFVKRGNTEVAKRTYWTKCGHEFEKNSTATVTGFKIPDSNERIISGICAACPFPVEVTEGWGENKKHVRWECRAGSQPPNHTTEWTGSLTDKNSIQIHSLDVALMEEIMSYCEAHPALGAAYNTDHLEDCRRTIAVHCISNKTGIAAKQELIKKFFPEKTEDDDLCEESPTNTGSDLCAFGTQEDIATSTVDKPTAMTARDSSGTTQMTCQECRLFGEKLQSEACGNSYRCHHIYPGGRPGITIPSNTACEHFIEKGERENMQKTAENDAFLPENITKTNGIVAFDYSTVDDETGAFLQEKANRIMEIRIKSIIATGKELSEARSKLSSHNKYEGVFGKWTESLSISRQTVQNYIQSYEYVVKNFDNIELLGNLQQSLLFAISKPSARPELQQAVLAGDIKTHKEYKELESKLQETEYRLKAVGKSNERFEQANREFEKEVQKLKTENRNTFEAYQKDLKNLHQQLDQARQNSDKGRVQELQKEIEELRQQLKDKPIEATATRVVEKLPDDVQEYLSSVNVTMRHMQNFAKVNQVLNLIVGLSTDELQSWAMMMNNRKAVGDDEEAETLELLSSAIQSLEDMKEDYENRGCGD